MQHKLMKTTGCRKCDHRACQKQLLVDEFGHAHSVSQKMPLVWIVSIRSVEFAQSDFRRQHPTPPFPSTTSENLPRTFLRETPPAGHTAPKRGTLNVSHPPPGSCRDDAKHVPAGSARKIAGHAGNCCVMAQEMPITSLSPQRIITWYGTS